MKTKDIPLEDITLDLRLQMRAAMSEEAVEDYCQQIDQLPPAKVALDEDGHLYLYDGWHTYYAHQKAERKTIRCETVEGDFRKAMLLAAGANEKHGVRRTKADKAKAVRTLLGDAEYAAMSDRWLADACNVSHQMVSTIRASTGRATSSNGSARKGKDGKVRKLPAAKTQAAFCPRCQRVGPVKGCAACKEARRTAKGREPGDDSQSEAESRQRNGTAKPGRETFDWREFDKNLGPVARGPDSLAKAFKGEKQSTEYKECSASLDAFCAAWTRWKKRLTRSK